MRTGMWIDKADGVKAQGKRELAYMFCIGYTRSAAKERGRKVNILWGSFKEQPIKLLPCFKRSKNEQNILEWCGSKTDTPETEVEGSVKVEWKTVEGIVNLVSWIILGLCYMEPFPLQHRSTQSAAIAADAEGAAGRVPSQAGRRVLQ
ncbi:hypothetical protein AOLI_G00006760 [Acnodon oligacanthus]